MKNKEFYYRVVLHDGARNQSKNGFTVNGIPVSSVLVNKVKRQWDNLVWYAFTFHESKLRIMYRNGEYDKYTINKDIIL